MKSKAEMSNYVTHSSHPEISCHFFERYKSFPNPQQTFCTIPSGLHEVSNNFNNSRMAYLKMMPQENPPGQISYCHISAKEKLYEVVVRQVHITNSNWYW